MKAIRHSALSKPKAELHRGRDVCKEIKRIRWAAGIAERLWNFCCIVEGYVKVSPALWRMPSTLLVLDVRGHLIYDLSYVLFRC